MKPSISGAAVIAAICLPVGAQAGRTVQPQPSGIVIHLFDNGSPTSSPAAPGASITAPKGGTAPVSAGFVRALAKMLNDSGTPTGLTGRAAGLPPQSVPRNERHPAS
ncbi:MAG TPA: hypothetical protein VFN77_10580 [Acetobacteraceae bacterium]|nr:hypothetical protein [Acetobacteraceae bacterium]